MQAFSHKYEIFFGDTFYQTVIHKEKINTENTAQGNRTYDHFREEGKNKEIHAHRSHYGNVFRYQNLCILHLQRNVQNSNCRRRRRLQ